jgi:hypothetical protein
MFSQMLKNTLKLVISKVPLSKASEICSEQRARPLKTQSLRLHQNEVLFDLFEPSPTRHNSFEL